MRPALVLLALAAACEAPTTTTTQPLTTDRPMTTAPTMTTTPTTTAPTPTTTTTWSKATAARAFAFLEPAMGSCFAIAPEDHGTLTVIVELGEGGVVRKVDFAPSSTLANTGVRACLARIQLR